MARTRRSKRYYRKAVWSTRLTNFSGAQSVSAGSQAVIYSNLCQNPAQSNDTVSNKYTVKNIDLQFELSYGLNQSATNDLENFQYFVMFIPQGYAPTGAPSAYSTLPFDHPEWIMVHRFIGNPLGDLSTSYPPVHVKSRLARKLDTGDRIILLILGQNTSTNNVSYTVDYRGLVKYNTKAN